MAYGKIDPRIADATTTAAAAVAAARRETIAITEGLRTVQELHREQLAELQALVTRHAATIIGISGALGELRDRITVLEGGTVTR